jgi:protein-tyrosine kinase
MSRIFEALTEAEKQKSGARRERQTLISRVLRKSKAAPLRRLTGPSADEYNLLRLNIVRLMSHVKPRVLVFASAADGEGSSNVVSGFGLTVPTWEEKVLLVDADVWDPHLHLVFGVAQVPGATELVSGERDLQEVVHQTEVDGLLVLPGGSPVNHPFSVKALRRLQAATDAIRTSVDWIVFNCAPVNSNHYTAPFAAMVGDAVLVVQAEKTRREVAERAKARLQKAGANILGVVLNDRRYHIPTWICRRF